MSRPTRTLSIVELIGLFMLTAFLLSWLPPTCAYSTPLSESNPAGSGDAGVLRPPEPAVSYPEPDGTFEIGAFRALRDRARQATADLPAAGVSTEDLHRSCAPENLSPALRTSAPAVGDPHLNRKTSWTLSESSSP